MKIEITRAKQIGSSWYILVPKDYRDINPNFLDEKKKYKMTVEEVSQNDPVEQ